MERADADGRGLVEWSVAATPFPGEPVAGDRAFVVEHDRGTLVAALDGLGHGPAAAQATKTAADVLTAFSGDSIVELVERCHEALEETRGAALSLAFFSAEDETMSWLGVGNVEGRVVRARPPGAALLLQPGVVGHELPTLSEETLEMRLGDTLLLATDGIDDAFVDAESEDLSGSTREIADRILAEHGAAADDSLVVVARYLGSAP